MFTIMTQTLVKDGAIIMLVWHVTSSRIEYVYN